MKSFVFASLALAYVMLCGAASAATIILANTPGANGMGATNTNIGNTFGDNINMSDPGNAVFATSAGIVGAVGTPNLDLTWSRSGTASGASAWQFHSATAGTPLAGGGALQMDGLAVGSTYSITFTPTSLTGVVLSGFNFINDTGSIATPANVKYNIAINVVDVTTSSTLYTTSFVFNPSLANTVPLATVSLNGANGVTGVLGDTLRLDLVRSAASSGTDGSAQDIYIDNLRFDQVPEPSRALLMIAGCGMMLARRHRKRVR